MGDQDSGCWYRFRGFQIVRASNNPIESRAAFLSLPKKYPDSMRVSSHHRYGQNRHSILECVKHAAEGKQPQKSWSGQERESPINGAALRSGAAITAIDCCGVKPRGLKRVSERDDSEEGDSQRKRL